MAMPRSRARIELRCRRPAGPPRDSRPPAYHRRMIDPTGPPRGAVPARARRGIAPRFGSSALPELAGVRPIDAAEPFRDLPGLALLESARPGRNAPLVVPDRRPDRGARGALARARSVRGRPPAARPARARADPDRPSGPPPFLGGLVGYLCYDLGRRLERLPSIAADDQALPLLRLALHDWVVAWDRRTGRPGSAVGRSMATRAASTGGSRRSATDCPRRLAARRSPRDAARRPSVSPRGSTARRTRPASSRSATHIARGDIYQANLTRRLETPFDGDPWPLYRRLRTGDPALFAAYLDLGPAAGAPAIVGLAGAVPLGRPARPSSRPTRSRAPGRAAATRDEDRALACELLASAKDRAENVMIVDVLRNDLGRVCVPGHRPRAAAVPPRADGRRPAPRLDGDRPPRPGPRRLRPPRGVLPGRLDHRRPEDPGDGAPRGARAGPARAVHGRARLDRAGRGDGDEHPHPHVRRGRLAADASTSAAGSPGGSDPAAEWDETVAKARGPLGAIGGARSARVTRSRPTGRARLGRRPARAGRRASSLGLRPRLPAR